MKGCTEFCRDLETVFVKTTPWEDGVTSVNLVTTIYQQKILRGVKVII